MAQFMKIATKDKAEILVTGKVALLLVGDKKIKFFIHAGTGTLSHFASGFRFGDFRDLQLQHMCRAGHNARLPDRTAAQALIDRIVSRMGAEKVVETMNAQPVINS